MRHCFAPHISLMIKEHFNKVDHLHEAEKINLPESDGSIIETAISKVVDVEIFVSEIVVMVT